MTSPTAAKAAKTATRYGRTFPSIFLKRMDLLFTFSRVCTNTAHHPSYFVLFQVGAIEHSNHFSPVHDGDPVTQKEKLIKVFGNQQCRHSIFLVLKKAGVNEINRGDIQPAGGVVSNQQLAGA